MDFDVNQSSNRIDLAARFHSRLHRYTHLLRKRWWVLLLTVSAALAVQAWWVWKTPATYASYGRMIVNAQVNLPGITDSSLYQEELQNFFGTQMALMQSEIVTTRAQEHLQVAKPELEPSEVQLTVSQSPRTSIFILQTLGSEPRYTQAYLDACMHEYIRYKNEQHSQHSETTLTAITTELSRLEAELRTGEEDLHTFQRQNNVVFLEEQGSSASKYLVSLHTQMAQLRTEFELLEALTLEQNLERQKNDPAGATATTNLKSQPTDGSYLQARHKIQVLKAELDDWSQYMRPKHPKIVQFQEEISRQENLLEILRQQSTAQLANRSHSLKLQIENLATVIKEWEVKSLEASRGMSEFQRIKAKLQRSQNLFDRLLSTVQSVDVSNNIKQDRIAILERATKSVPRKPGLAKSLTVAGFLGLGFGIGLLWFLARIDDRPASFTDLAEMFDETLLGQIPFEKSGPGRKPVALLESEDARHGFAEAYRNLRSALLFMPKEGQRTKVILVTSAVPGEGKSTISADLAIVLAQGGSKVLLIDADLRRGVMHDSFGIPSKPGLAEVLAQETSWSKTLATNSVPNLSLVARGDIPRRPGELLLSPAVDILLREAQEQFDYVLIDSAPVLATDDSANLAPKVDGVLFVIRANYTAARLAHTALDHLYQRQAKVLGLVFNAVDTRHRDYYYYYKYSSYYKYSNYHLPKEEKAEKVKT